MALGCPAGMRGGRTLIRPRGGESCGEDVCSCVHVEEKAAAGPRGRGAGRRRGEAGAGACEVLGACARSRARVRFAGAQEDMLRWCQEEHRVELINHKSQVDSDDEREGLRRTRTDATREARGAGERGVRYQGRVGEEAML